MQVTLKETERIDDLQLKGLKYKIKQGSVLE